MFYLITSFDDGDFSIMLTYTNIQDKTDKNDCIELEDTWKSGSMQYHAAYEISWNIR